MLFKNSMNCMAIIPARLGSTRLKDKPLQLINGTPLVKLVAEEVEKTDLFKTVVVATDSEKIVEVFKGTDVKCVMTSESHQSGTDRINEAVSKLSENPDFVLNIQGDEPFIYKEDLESMIEALSNGYEMVSAYEELKTADLENLNKVKVILNENSEAIYFSRLPVPFSRSKASKALDSKKMGKHVGLYGYKRSFLESFCSKGPSFLEVSEKLEQLRALEMGQKIKMIFTGNAYKGVDTEEDIKEVEALLSKVSKKGLE